MNIDKDTIFPTGSCFDDTADYMLLNPEGDEYFLVHGICTMQDGSLYSHAWLEHRIEQETLAFGLVNIKGVPHRIIFVMSIQDYHNHYQVVDFKKYTLEEVIKKMMKQGTNGPWVDDYLEKCAKVKSDEKR
ncbi:MAG: hypothetical protein RLZZ74_3462 [Cyanobacteriota bacterium]|jgi:hypothetical protein